MFTDLDLPKLQSEDVATNFPGMTEAFLRLYTAYQEEQLALADRDAETPRGGDGNARRTDAVAEARRFLTARRNSFPALDEAAEALAATEIGRASCRERVCEYVLISVVAVTLKKKTNNIMSDDDSLSIHKD